MIGNEDCRTFELNQVCHAGNPDARADVIKGKLDLENALRPYFCRLHAFHGLAAVLPYDPECLEIEGESGAKEYL